MALIKFDKEMEEKYGFIATLDGIPVKLVPTYKVRKKIHRNKLIDWFYKLIYGWETKYEFMDDDTNYMYICGTIWVKNREALEELRRYVNERLRL